MSFDYNAAFKHAARAIVDRMLRGNRLTLLNWRHHALGMLQAELTSNLRVHVWDPALRMLEENSMRSVHDHRFDLYSYVAVGSITDMPHDVHFVAFTENGATPGCAVEGYHQGWLTDAYSIEHAKIQKGDGTFFARVKCERWQHRARQQSAGSVYHIRRRDFHTTVVDSLAVTIVARDNFDTLPAIVLGDGRSGIVKPEEWCAKQEAREEYYRILSHTLAQAQLAINDLPCT